MSVDEECLFCSIERLQPELIVYSTADVIAFFDINPLVISEAHLLLIPRRHYAKLSEVPSPDARALGEALPTVAKALLESTGATDFNVVQNNGPRAGQVVNHVHFHIVIRGEGNSSALSLDPATVAKIKERFTLRERVTYGSTVFGKGQRTGLGDINELRARLRTRLAKL